MPRLYDVSLTIHSGMKVWPGDAPVELETLTDMSDSLCNLSALRLGSHAGTHVDAPRHFLTDGVGVDDIKLDLLVGPARLFQLTDAACIDRKLLEGLDLEGVSRLLLGTRNSALWRQAEFCEDYIYLTEDAAAYLVEKQIKLVGIDYLSVEEFNSVENPVHYILLGAGTVIIEGLDFTNVPPGDYELLCLPLKVKGADGAPARVILKEIKCQH